MTKESQETIRRLEVLAINYDLTADMDREMGFSTADSDHKARSLRAAIKQIEMMEGE